MKSSLQLEELEGRDLPSATTLLPFDPLPPVPRPNVISGIYTSGPLQVDAGMNYRLAGIGAALGMGPVTARGVLQGLGFVAAGHAHGSLTLKGAKGTLTLGLLGPEQNGFAPLPTHFYFHVVGGTGAYKHTAISGWLDVHFRPFTVQPLTPLLVGGTGGTFTLTIHPWKA